MPSNTPIGVTFAPTPDQAELAKKNMSLQGGSPEAIQILSMHVPKFAGTRPLAANELLTAQPANPGNAVVENILREMGLVNTPQAQSTQGEGGDLASMFRQATGGGVGQRYEPTPSITPGVDTLPQGMPPLPSTVTNQSTQPIPPSAVQGGPELFPGPGTGRPFGTPEKPAPKQNPWMTERNFF